LGLSYSSRISSSKSESKSVPEAEGEGFLGLPLTPFLPFADDPLTLIFLEGDGEADFSSFLILEERSENYSELFSWEEYDFPGGGVRSKVFSIWLLPEREGVAFLEWVVG